MKNKKLIKEDIESIKFMMNYDTRKTLTENREILNEQPYPPFKPDGKIFINPGPFSLGIAREIADGSVGNFLGGKAPDIYKAIQKIKDVQTYYNVNSLISQYTFGSHKDISNLINKVFMGHNLIYVSKIAYHLKQIPGLDSNYSVDDKYKDQFKKGSFTISGIPYDPRLKTVPGGGSDPNNISKPAESEKKPVTPLPIPPQLKDSAGVKKFQEWVIGIKGDKKILGGYAADGKFGDRTSKAWTAYGNEYLNPKLETLKPLEVKPITSAQTIGGNTQPQPELQLPNSQLQQAPQTDQNMSGKQKRQFNSFVRKQERIKKRNQNQNQTQNKPIDSNIPQSNTNQSGPTNANA